MNLNDRPIYHLSARPEEGVCCPYDPNGAIYWRGRYHLMYIFQDPSLPQGGHSWGHLSSSDLLNWETHPTALFPAPGDADTGTFSGNAFVSKEGRPMLCWFGIDAGVCIAEATDDGLSGWEKHPRNPIIPIPRPDEGEYTVWDPYLWLEGDTYYCLLGGNQLPNGKDTLRLCRSDDLIHWDHLGPFYEHPDLSWTEDGEDCSCPDFFPLGDRRVLLCISHKIGARCYVGRYEGERFQPERHVRLNWPGGMYFAPESLVDDRGRRIVWAWVTDPRTAPAQREAGSGVMSLPRILTLEGEDLRMEPIPELAQLRRSHVGRRDLELNDAEIEVEEIRGAFLEVSLEVHAAGAGEVGIKVRCAPDGSEETAIVYLPDEGRLRVDMSRSTLREDVVYGIPPFHAAHIQDASEHTQTCDRVEAPLELLEGEPLRLRVFLDGPILEVFANGRQAITQQIYPQGEESVRVKLFARGGEAAFKNVEAWEMGGISVSPILH